MTSQTCTQSSAPNELNKFLQSPDQNCDDNYVQSQFMQARIRVAVMTTTKPLNIIVWRICLSAKLAHIIWGGIDVHMRWLKLFILWLLHTNDMTKCTNNELYNYAALRPSCRAYMWQSITNIDWPQTTIHRKIRPRTPREMNRRGRRRRIVFSACHINYFNSAGAQSHLSITYR